MSAAIQGWSMPISVAMDCTLDESVTDRIFFPNVMHYILQQNGLLDSSLDTNAARFEVLVIVFDDAFCHTVKTKKAKAFTAVSTFDPIDLFDSEIITLEQRAYRKILFGLLGSESITLKQWTNKQEVVMGNNKTGKDLNAFSFGSASSTECALAHRNSKTLAALDISWGDSTVCTSTESDIDCTVCAANRNLKILIALDILLDDSKACTASEK